MLNKLIWRMLFLVCGLVLSSGGNISAAAPVTYSLWGANWGGFLGNHPLSVGQIDPVTGQVLRYPSIPGSMSRSGVLDFASDPSRQPSLVWSLHQTQQHGFELLSFDPYQQLVLSNVSLDDSLELRGLAIDPTTGLFYATSESNLYRLDPATGQADLIGPTSLPAQGRPQYLYALGFDLAGNLFNISEISSGVRGLFAIDKLTGQSSLIAKVDVLPADIAVHPVTGVMYGLGYDNTPSVDYALYQIDLTTGAITNIGPSLVRPGGLAFTVIPEPTTACISTLLGITVLAWIDRARRLKRKMI